MKEYNSCKSTIRECISKNILQSPTCTMRTTMDMHIHDYYEMYYSISGGKQFLIDKFYDIHPGDLFVINQYESHYLSKIDQPKLDRIVISIHPDFMKSVSTDKTKLSTCFTDRSGNYSHKSH